jgi:hypothetical protein
MDEQKKVNTEEKGGKDFLHIHYKYARKVFLQTEMRCS